MHEGAAALDAPGSLASDGRRRIVHPADVHGRFTRLRHAGFVVLVGTYAALPWIEIGGHPAVFLDIAQRRFFLFGATFNAQDAWLVFFLITGGAFALIALTTVLGRVWCGYVCPQTVFLEGVFRRVERWIEGPREQRIRRDAAPWTFGKLWRRSLLHAAYAGLALVLAHVLLSYFTSLEALFAMVRVKPARHPEAFAWVAGISLALYANFAWFREQLCLIVCPYGRLQSVLTDRDTVTIGYDSRRGEPRGKLGSDGAGDCVDCQRCVVVCPTAIDIRNGSQLECVGCAACVDACDAIMDRLARPRGLIRYDSLRGFEGGARRLVRPRLALYAFLGLIGAAVAATAFAKRAPFEANLLRTQGPPFVVEGGVVRNTFHVHVINKSSEPASFTVRAAPRGAALGYIVPISTVTVPSLGSVNLPVMASAPQSAAQEGATVGVTVEMARPGAPARELLAPFLAPTGRGGT